MTTEQKKGDGQTQGDKPDRTPSIVLQFTDQLKAACERRDLKVRRLAPHVLVCTRPLVGESGDDPASQALAGSFRQGLSQTVALLPDGTVQQVPGGPMTLAWYWWWRGDRLTDHHRPGQPGLDEKERLADADAIEYAAGRIAHVIGLVDGDS